MRVRTVHGSLLCSAARSAVILLPLLALGSCVSSAIQDVAASPSLTVDENLSGLEAQLPTASETPATSGSEATEVASLAATEQQGEETVLPSAAESGPEQPQDVAALVMEPTTVNAGIQSIYAAATPPVVLPNAKQEPSRKLTLASLFAPPAKPVTTAAAATMSDIAPVNPPLPQEDEDANDAGGLAALISAPGLARIATNGLWVQTEKVDTHCFKPDLIHLIKRVEKHFGKPAVVTSGYRDVRNNRRAGGSSFSRHTTCDAADVQIKDVSKWELAEYVRSLPERGGVGTYCHTRSVHIDTGSVRDWNWRCRRKKK